MTPIHNPILITPQRPLPQWLGVIGAGTIGPDIAYYLKSQMPGLHLVLVDIAGEALDRAVDRIHTCIDKGVQRGRIDPGRIDDVRANILPSTDYETLTYCDWVIEAATENLDLKKKIFTQVESLVRDDTLITSNTSAIPAARLFSHLRHPERTTVTHFFAPAFRNPAVEVINWDGADPRNIDYLRWLFYVTGKVPLPTRDVVCFMLDRVFDNWCNEAALLLDTATPAQVDTVAAEFVHAGPFQVLNLANGNPIIIETNTLQMEEEGEHYRPAEIFRTAGRWDTVEPGARVEVPESIAGPVRDRLLGVLFSQTVDIIDRDIGAAPDLDIGCRLGLGFRKGPLELMRGLGEKEVRRIMSGFRKARPGMPAPGRPIGTYHECRRHVLVDRIEEFILVTLRRPEALNALHDGMTDEILAVIRGFEADQSVAGFVVTGFGTRAFSAGADIGRFPSVLGRLGPAVEYARSCSRLLEYLDTCAKPVVAALNGMALGGGLELAIRCHGMVSVRDAWFQFPEITLGIVPGIGGMVVPYRRWPQAAATFHGMLARAEKLSAEQATEIGMIDTLVEDHAHLIPAATWLLREMKDRGHRVAPGPIRIAPMVIEVNNPVSAAGQRLSPEVLEIMRRAVHEAAGASTLDRALEIGYQASGASACTAAAREGIEAFTERRQPDFAKTG